MKKLILCLLTAGICFSAVGCTSTTTNKTNNSTITTSNSTVTTNAASNGIITEEVAKDLAAKALYEKLQEEVDGKKSHGKIVDVTMTKFDVSKVEKESNGFYYVYGKYYVYDEHGSYCGSYGYTVIVRTDGSAYVFEWLG